MGALQWQARADPPRYARPSRQVACSWWRSRRIVLSRLSVRPAASAVVAPAAPRTTQRRCSCAATSPSPTRRPQRRDDHRARTEPRNRERVLGPPPGHPAIARRPRRRPPGGGPRRGDRALTSLVVTPRAIARDCLLPPVARFRPPIPVRICRAGLLAGDAVGCLIQRYPGSLMSVVSNPLARSARKWRLVQGRRRRAPCRPDRAPEGPPSSLPSQGVRVIVWPVVTCLSPASSPTSAPGWRTGSATQSFPPVAVTVCRPGGERTAGRRLPRWTFGPRPGRTCAPGASTRPPPLLAWK
jgi:hypothetical protein